MTRSKTLALLAALGATLLAGCDSSATGPAASRRTLRPTASASADGSSNVGEITFPYVFGIFDEETQLLAVFGLPADATDWEGCGGTVPGALLTLQQIELKSGVVKSLAHDADVAIQVFRTTGEHEGEFGLEGVAPLVCETSPIATGTGRLQLTGNDFEGVGGGPLLISMSLGATLADLETGGLVRLTATNKLRADLRDGFTLRQLDGRVQLHPIGAP
jgi:hypothetical protein